MEAKDLMIGDWVLHNWGEKQPCKVTCVLCEEISVYFGEDVMDLNEGEFEPIPITYEFLEKNFGLKTDENTFAVGYVEYARKGYFYYVEKRGDKFRFLSKKLWVCDIKYVHELQHALRLIGLSEMADNLKV